MGVSLGATVEQGGVRFRVWAPKFNQLQLVLNPNAVEVKDVVRYEAALLSYLRSEHADILKAIRDSKQLDDDTAKKLKDALAAFGKQFA